MPSDAGHRLFVAIAGYPLLGLGIDEDTALVVHGHVGEVVGRGGVTFVDGRDTVRYDNASRVTKGGELTLSHLRVGLVGTAHKFDLRARSWRRWWRPEAGRRGAMISCAARFVRAGIYRRPGGNYDRDGKRRKQPDQENKVPELLKDPGSTTLTPLTP